MSGIIFLNQGGGQMFRELVIAAAQHHDPVVYFGPDPQSLLPATVQVIPSPAYRAQSIASRLGSWLRYLLHVTIPVLRWRGRPHLFIVTNPPLSPIVGLLAHALKRQPYTLLFYDLYPEAVERFGGLSPRSPIAWLWRRLNRWAINRADQVVTISPHLAHTIGQYLPDARGRTTPSIVPTWVDTAQIMPIPKADNWFAAQHGQTDKLTVLYAGNMGSVHDLAILPALAQRLLDHPRLHFLLIGDGARRAALQAECRQLQLTNVTFLPYQPESVLPFALACGDIGIVALAAGAEGVSMPSKTYYTMAAGSAILGLSTAHSDLAHVIHTHQCGVNVPPTAVDAAAHAILSYLDQPDRLAQHRHNARAAAVQHYSNTVCIPQLLALLPGAGNASVAL